MYPCINKNAGLNNNLLITHFQLVRYLLRIQKYPVNNTYNTIIFLGAKTIVVAIYITILLLPVCINCAMYITLCYTTIGKSKDMMQEPVRKDNLELIKVTFGNSCY